MIDENESSQIHLRIGLIYLQSGGGESNYYAALHLHHVLDCATMESTRIDLAGINFKAAK